MRAHCPACGSSRMRTFYQAAAVPAESSIVFESREESLAVATGDIALALCRDCGFIANLAHPEHTRIPSRRYEDQQGYSNTFAAYASRIADELAQRYHLAGRTVVEVGCGKGDFLALLCERGRCRGVGIDPLFDGARLDERAAGRITAVAETYARAHARFAPDLIVCRHTLEHIPDTRRFLGTVGATMDASRKTALVIEVPDVTRILDEGAFWDVYYEHCSYFAPGSLARALRAVGLAVDEVRREYGDQYLIAHAHAGGEVPAGEIEESAGAMEERVGMFAGLADRARALWRQRLGAAPVIWGSGSKCVSFVTALGIADRLAAVVDINPHRHGLYMPGIPRAISAPESLRALAPEVIVAMNPLYRDEIEAAVRSMGLDSEVVAPGAS